MGEIKINRIETITTRDTWVVKGFAILAMIFYHLFRDPVRWNGKEYVSVFHNIEFYFCNFGQLCIALFTILSGYGIYYVLTRVSKDSERWTIIFQRAIKSHLEISVLCVLIAIVRCQSGKVVFCFQELILNLLCIDNTYCAEWWFQGLYIQLMMLSPILFSMIIKSSNLTTGIRVIVMYILAFVVKCFCVIVPIGRYFSGTLFGGLFLNIIFWLPFFVLGMYLANSRLLLRLCNKVNAKTNSYINWMCILLALCVRIGCYWLPFILIHKEVHATWADFVIAPIVIINLLVIHFKNKGGVIDNFLACMGKHSKYMWLLHTLIAFSLFDGGILKLKYSLIIYFAVVFISFISAFLIDSFSVIVQQFSKRRML